jgi:outer membrane protein assembly factor BamB
VILGFALGVVAATWSPAVAAERLQRQVISDKERSAPAKARLGLHSNWPRFRGPGGDGHSPEVDLPAEWGPTKNLAWKTRLPGVGASSPVVWGDRIFLTATQEKGHRRLLLCLNRRDGSVRWQQLVSSGDPGPTHELNQHASSTCVTDGQHVWSFFGKGGLFCHDLDGRLVWKRQLGDFLSVWGTGASPILHGDKLIVNCDQDSKLESYPSQTLPSKASLLAVAKTTGKTIWQTRRAAARGWSTPVVLREPGGHEQLVLNGPDGVHGYDPQSGRDLWFSRRTILFGEPCVVAGHGLVFALSGRPGPLDAIRLGGEGDITGKRTAWSHKRGGRDVTSPVLVGDCLYTANMTGIVTCYDALNGKVRWSQRLGKSYTASFVAADDKVYLLARDGKTTVLAPGPELKVLAVNNLDAAGEEDFQASPAISNGQIFLRSDRMLYCVGAPR